MYSQGTVSGATTAAGVAALPNTGNNSVLTAIAITAIVGGLTAIAMQLAVSFYRRRALQG